MLFGKPITIKVIQNSQNSFEFINSSLIVNIEFDFSKEVKEQIREKFYKQTVKKHITPLVDKWAKKMNLYPSKISYRKTKSQWGSCSSKNAISLNIYLCLLPKELIEYVIVHELAHIKHKNHSKDFWSLVGEFIPDYKVLRANLKEYGSFLR